LVAETRTSRSLVSRQGDVVVERIAKPPKKPWWMRWKWRMRDRARAAYKELVGLWDLGVLFIGLTSESRM